MDTKEKDSMHRKACTKIKKKLSKSFKSKKESKANFPCEHRRSTYEKAYDKVHRKLSSSYISRTEMEVLLKEFYDLKSIIIERLLLIEIIDNEISLNQTKEFDDSDLFRLDYEEKIREHIRNAMDEWNEMYHLYKRESNQRNSKISENDLEVHRVLLLQIRDNIYAVNDEDLTGIPNNLGNGKRLKSASKKFSTHKESNKCSSKTSKSSITRQSKKQSKETHQETIKYDGKPIDEKIKRMEEKITNLKAVTINTDIERKKNTMIEENHGHGAFGLNETNKKLMAMNEALMLKRDEVVKENQKLMKFSLNEADVLFESSKF